MSLAGIGLLVLLAVVVIAAVVAMGLDQGPGVWLGVAALATVVVYFYGAAASLGEDSPAATSWIALCMAGLVVIGVGTFVVGRSGLAHVAVALSAAAIALGVAGLVLVA